MATKHITKHQGDGSPTLDFESFSDIPGPYLRKLCKTVADILTVTDTKAEEILKTNPKDAVEVCQAFMEGIKAHGSNTREWRSSSLALLPAENWVEFPDEPGTFSVKGMDKTTMVSYAYSQAAGGKSQSTEPKQLSNRRAVHKALFERLKQTQQKTYSPLIDWPEPPAGSPLTKVFPHMQDMNLWKLVDTQAAEYGICLYTGAPRASASSSSADKLAILKKHKRSVFASMADRGMSSNIADRADTLVSLLDFPIPERNLKPGMPGYLVIRLLCNVAANRAILEQGRRTELDATCEKVLVDFLAAIEARMLMPLPQSRVRPSLQDLADFLAKNFGREYSPLSKLDSAFYLSPKDITIVVNQAIELEASAKRSVSEVAESRMDGYTLFACLFAVMACRYSDEKVKDERRSGERRSIYPPKTDASPETWTPSAEARTLMKLMVSALEMSLQWGDLSSKTVGAISASATAESAMMQTLIFQIFKKSEPDTLLELAYLRQHELQLAHAKAYSRGRCLKFNRDEHMQMRYAIELNYGSWESTEPILGQAVLRYHFAPTPSNQQWSRLLHIGSDESCRAV